MCYSSRLFVTELLCTIFSGHYTCTYPTDRTTAQRHYTRTYLTDRTTAQTAVMWARIWSVPKKEVVRIRRHREVISEWSQGAGEAQAVDRTCRLTTQWWSGDLCRCHLVSVYSPTKLPCQWHSLIKIRQQDYYEVYCTQWNLEFTFPESTFSLTLHIFLLVLPQLPHKHYIFLKHILVLRSKLLNYMFQLSMNWHFCVILSTFSWKFGEEGDLL